LTKETYLVEGQWLNEQLDYARYKQ
jgi:hypothetical protein